ncbi:hypothetical protein IOLA_245 [uncultured bacterium]|nr:hypothetical protein [uncultured bacterium]BBH72535.1 hypothetical protein [uncultured bacterium]BBH72538.1 hypothetical protein [uncultured bacterium]BBH72541.1 hypothetical protein [uncultured bacterium]BBH72544.1 hypothetical protein [uncultured bacterium]
MNIFYAQKVTTNFLKVDIIHSILLIIFILISTILIFILRYYNKIISRIKNDINVSNTSLLNKIDENLKRSISYQF